MVETKKLLVKFRNGFGAPVTGITPSTQVGRLSGSHSDIGFQLTQFPGRRKVMEPKSEKSKELKVFEQLFLASCKTKCSQNARLSCNNVVEMVCGRYREQTTMDTKNSGRGKPVESMC